MSKKVMWTLEDAVEFIRRVSPDIRSTGCFISLYGSVLFSGESKNDLDILITPKRLHVNVKHILEVFNLVGYKATAPVYFGLMGTEAYLLKNNDGKTIDIQIRDLHEKKVFND